jgi:hypothetical protein
MIPHEREMVKRLADKPFTLLGINSDGSRSALKKIVEEQKITWPNIQDESPGTGKIAKRWNVSGWPTIYILDHTGKICYRDLRDEAMEKAVVELLRKVPDKEKPGKEKAAEEKGEKEKPAKDESEKPKPEKKKE